MAAEWFYSRDGQEHGPVSSGSLRELAQSGELLPTDHLWKEGMPDWRLASDFPQLFPDEEAATVILSPEPEGHLDDGPVITIDTTRSASRRKPASTKPRPVVRAKRRPQSAQPEVILGIQAEKWMAWFPWAMLLVSIGSVLAVVAMRATVLFAALAIKGIRLPPGIGGRPALDEPLIWKVAFFLNIAQAVAGLIAFPMLRARKANGWAIAFGSSIAWLLYETLAFLQRPAFSIFILFPVACTAPVAFALWQLRSRYGLEGTKYSSVVAPRAVPREHLQLPHDDAPPAEVAAAFPLGDSAEQMWQTVRSTASSLPAINIAKVKTKASATAKRATASFRSAGSLVAGKAELTKIATITLPTLYAELGKAVYEEGSRREEFILRFKAADDLLFQRKQLHDEANSRTAGVGLADKARKAAADAAGYARSKTIDLQAYQAFSALGEAVYSRYGSESGPAEIVEPIAKAIDRRNQLNRALAALETASQGQWLTPKRIVACAAALLVLCALTVRIPGVSFGSLGTTPGTKYLRLPKTSVVRESYERGWSRGLDLAEQWKSAWKQFGKTNDPNGMRAGLMQSITKNLDTFEWEVTRKTMAHDDFRAQVGREPPENMQADLAFWQGMLDGAQTIFRTIGRR